MSAWSYEGKYYGFDDAGLEGPYETEDYALAMMGIMDVNDATVRIWTRDRGVVWEAGRDSLPNGE